LGGGVAGELGNLTKLASLDLSFNHFTGTVPEDFTKLKPILGLRLNNNHLSAGSETVRQFLDQYHSGGATWSSSQSLWPGLLGDLNGDGAKDVLDLVALLRLVRRMDALNPDTLKAADGNGDQGVDSMDLQLLVPLP